MKLLQSKVFLMPMDILRGKNGIDKAKPLTMFALQGIATQLIGVSWDCFWMVWPGLLYRMPTNIDALYKMPTHGSKKVKWWSTGSGIQEIAKNSL